MKKVTELKDGIKVWIPFEVRTRGQNEPYPFQLINEGCTFTATKDCKQFIEQQSVEMYEQELVLNLTPVEMEVSSNGEKWMKKNVIGKLNNIYITDDLDCFYNARPIPKTVTIEIPEELLTEELIKFVITKKQ